MKEIIIKGKTFKYSITKGELYNMTTFYYGEEIEIINLFFFKITNRYPIEAFVIFINIEDPSYSKLFIKDKIISEAENYFRKIERQKEIEKGEII